MVRGTNVVELAGVESALPCFRGTARSRIWLRTARAGDWCQGRSCGGALLISPIGDQPDVHNVLLRLGRESISILLIFFQMRLGSIT